MAQTARSPKNNMKPGQLTMTNCKRVDIHWPFIHARIYSPDFAILSRPPANLCLPRLFPLFAPLVERVFRLRPPLADSSDSRQSRKSRQSHARRVPNKMEMRPRKDTGNKPHPARDLGDNRRSPWLFAAGGDSTRLKGSKNQKKEGSTFLRHPARSDRQLFRFPPGA